jgi:prepilin-type processing-associated H-X9-DG protein
VGGGINGNLFSSALSGPVPSWMEGADEVEAELADPEDPEAGPIEGADDPEAAASAVDDALTVGGFGSAHNGGAHVAFGDGSVRFLIDTIDAETLRRLANRADGLLVEGF